MPFVGVMNQNDVAKYIESGLNKDLPVAMVMHFNTSENLASYQLHWMTITALNYDTDSENYQIVVSTWGESRVLNLNDIVTKSSYLGVVYFE